MKRKREQTPLKSELILYQAADGKTKVEVRLQDETVWLTQKLMAELFQSPPLEHHDAFEKYLQRRRIGRVVNL